MMNCILYGTAPNGMRQDIELVISTWQRHDTREQSPIKAHEQKNQSETIVYIQDKLLR